MFGFIFGVAVCCIVLDSRRKFSTSRKPESKAEPQRPEDEAIYEELDFSKLNKHDDNYESFRGNAASNCALNGDNDDPSYTKLKKIRDVEDNYQSLTKHELNV